VQGPLSYRSRTVDGPADDYLTLPECGAYLRLSAKTLTRLIAEGRFPRPKRVTKGTAYWLWLDVVAYREWSDRLEAGPELVPETGVK
jgi:predicted DNA-binding transcriptional regulator AlpA